jgi:hypothetical protein
MSNGTSALRFLDPTTLSETGRIRITLNGNPVQNVNKLEWVNGDLCQRLANELDPSNRPNQRRSGRFDQSVGIAQTGGYRSGADRLAQRHCLRCQEQSAVRDGKELTEAV